MIDFNNQDFDLDNGLFSKIVRKEIPAKIEYQDDDVTVFHDINPQAKVHLLIIPNKCIPTVDHVDNDDALVLGKLFLVAKEVATKMNIDETGYRLIVNCKNDGGQEVPHIHMHLLGGEAIGPMRSK